MAEHPDYGTPEELSVFNYIYGVLHCPHYRKKYEDFLVGFPRIPWPSSPDEFWDISQKGASLSKLHLMKPGSIADAHYPFEVEGDNVDKLSFEFEQGLD